jgi:uncharacterized protein YdeI (YjbR/CyaY-like superfamily)
MEAVSPKPEQPVIAFESQRKWEAWLEKNHATSSGLWLKLAKKESGHASVSYAEALDSALCYGWIDGQKNALDATHWLQRFTPRGPRSKWSKINTEKVLALTQQGRMKDAGLLEVQKAQQDGRWAAAYDGQRKAAVPEDLQHAFEQNPKALAFFEALNSANRYAILYRVQDAKKPETRARRIEQFVAMCAEHKKLHP